MRLTAFTPSADGDLRELALGPCRRAGCGRTCRSCVVLPLTGATARTVPAGLVIQDVDKASRHERSWPANGHDQRPVPRRTSHAIAVRVHQERKSGDCEVSGPCRAHRRRARVSKDRVTLHRPGVTGARARPGVRRHHSARRAIPEHFRRGRRLRPARAGGPSACARRPAGSARSRARCTRRRPRRASSRTGGTAPTRRCAS